MNIISTTDITFILANLENFSLQSIPTVTEGKTFCTHKTRFDRLKSITPLGLSAADVANRAGDD